MYPLSRGWRLRAVNKLGCLKPANEADPRPAVSGLHRERPLARNHYGTDKRQRELSKERKKEEKRQRKLDRKSARDVSDSVPDAEESADPDRGPAP